MYKKITTIEEHYHDDPSKAKIYLPSNAYSVDAVNLRMKIRDRFAAYVGDFRNYVISRTNKTNDVTEVVAQLSSNIPLLANVIQPYITADQSVSFIEAFNTMTDSIISVINDTVDGKDVTASTTTAKNAILHLAMVLNNLNIIQRQFTEPLWNDFLTQTQTQVASRKQAKWKDEQDSYDKAYYYIVSGDTDLTTQIGSFADQLFKGIITKRSY